METSSLNNIIIFGGTFDPPTNAHVEIVKRLKEIYKPSKVFVIPVFNHPSKTNLTSFKDRLKMTKLAFKDLANVEVSSVEEVLYPKALEAGLKFVPTVLVTSFYKEIYWNSKIYLAMGSDNLSRLDSWFQSDKLKRDVQIIEIKRSGEETQNNKITNLSISINSYINISSGKIKSGKFLSAPYGVLLYIVENNLYFMPEITKRLSRARFDHSVSVAKTAYEIAVCNNLDPYKAFEAGLYHDIAKDLDKPTQRKLMEERYPEYVSFPSFSYHQFLGRDIAKNTFKVEDEEILDSILFHCTGKADMSLMEKCVYTADKVEPLRDYDTLEMRKTALADLDKGFKMVLEDQVRYLNEINKGFHTNPFSIEMYSMYINK